MSALKHPYFKKYVKDEIDVDSSTMVKFDEVCGVDDEDWIKCIEENVEIRNQ
jgi:hypothetical protein